MYHHISLVAMVCQLKAVEPVLQTHQVFTSRNCHFPPLARERIGKDLKQPGSRRCNQKQNSLSSWKVKLVRGSSKCISLHQRLMVLCGRNWRTTMTIADVLVVVALLSNDNCTICVSTSGWFEVTQLYQIDVLWMYHNYLPYLKCGWSTYFIFQNELYKQKPRA